MTDVDSRKVLALRGSVLPGRIAWAMALKKSSDRDQLLDSGRLNPRSVMQQLIKTGD